MAEPLATRETEDERLGKILDDGLSGPRPESITSKCPACSAWSATRWEEVNGSLTYSCDNCFAGMRGEGRPLWPIQPPKATLEFLSVARLGARVRAAGPRRFLLRGLWPSGDYGIFAAEPKAQKTWATVDLALSVASGEPWLGRVPIDDPGAVLMFCGEGGEGNTYRRLDATARSRGVSLEHLPIEACFRAPHLGDAEHMRIVGEHLQATKPKLVTLDPLYLSARGANLASLYEMGAHLETIQHLCSAIGASLWVVTHFNRQEGKKGASRILGSGPAEWGRVLVTAEVKVKHTDPATRGTDVTTELTFQGGEIPDTTLRVRRQIRADDPASLDSPLTLALSCEEGGSPAQNPSGPRLGPAAEKLLAALRALRRPATQASLVDWMAKEENFGHGLRRETASRTLCELERLGLASSEAQGFNKLWSLGEEQS